MANVGFLWLKPPSLMAAECERRREQIPPTLGAELSDLAGAIEAEMKAGHPWTNRTGEAEAGLRAEWIDEGEVQTVAAYSEAPHGIYLEMGTRYMSARPIVGPTLEANYGKARAIMDLIAS